MKKHNSNINKRNCHSQQFLTDTFIKISGQRLSILAMSFRKKENKKMANNIGIFEWWKSQNNDITKNYDKVFSEVEL